MTSLFSFSLFSKLENYHFLRLRTLVALSHDELNTLSFGKGTITILLDRSVMYKNIFS
jgi:beta-N-acetylglucosaminidase